MTDRADAPFTGLAADLVAEWMESEVWPKRREVQAWASAYAVLLLMNVPYGWMSGRSRQRAKMYLDTLSRPPAVVST